METITEKDHRYRQIIQELLARLAAIPSLEEGVEDRTLFDQNNDSYAIIAEGWDGEDRIHYVVAHLEIIGGKVWIQADNTDMVLARELESGGIPKSDIVLGFRCPSVGSQTEYAAY